MVLQRTASLILLVLLAMGLAGCGNSRPTPQPTRVGNITPTLASGIPTFAPLATPTPQVISQLATLAPATATASRPSSVTAVRVAPTTAAATRVPSSPTRLPASPTSLPPTAVPVSSTPVILPTNTLLPPSPTLLPSNTPLPTSTPIPSDTPVPPTSTPLPKFAGKVVGQRNDTNLYVANAGSANLRVIADVATPLNSYAPQFPRWSPSESQIVFVAKSKGGGGSGIYLINADGSGLSELVSGSRSELVRDRENPALGWPTWSPDGTQVAFTATYENGDSQVTAISVASKTIRQIAGWKRDAGPDFAPVAAEWSPDGSLMALEMKSKRLTLVRTRDGGGDNTFGSGYLGGWGPDGFIYFGQFEGDKSRYQLPIYRADTRGNTEPFAEGGLAGYLPRWSGDGQHIYTLQGQNGPYIVANADGSGAETLETGGLWQIDWK